MTAWQKIKKTLRKNYEYASERSERVLKKNLHLLILKPLFPSIFCWYLRYFVSETYFIFRSPITSAYIIYNQRSFLSLLIMVWHYNDGMPAKHSHWENPYVSERSERAKKIFAFSPSITAISFNIWLVLQDICRYKQHTCLLMYRQISKCTDKTPKKHYGVVPPPPGYSSAFRHTNGWLF